MGQTVAAVEKGRFRSHGITGGSALPKIEVHRKAFHRELICRGERDDPALAAVASDEPLALDVPVLELNDPGAIAEFIASLVSGIDVKP